MNQPIIKLIPIADPATIRMIRSLISQGAHPMAEGERDQKQEGERANPAQDRTMNYGTAPGKPEGSPKPAKACCVDMGLLAADNKELQRQLGVAKNEIARLRRKFEMIRNVVLLETEEARE
ncbi:hypothetical protein [Cupriavidus metallidurans]|uniref:hypothetical protein n=1 Tax=Cupriavidus metallidurans TaxID=119219 RepID=UPI001CCC081D|nr:hypothetical protein [Cupriavidus metallidurans]UBM12696.1 hypothetical protein LAI70_28190 [Cupriavidus metallidurans]